MDTLIPNASDLVGQAKHFGALLLSVTWVETALGFIVFTSWTVSCWKLTKRFRLDWWMSLVTFIMCCLSQVFLTTCTFYATGRFNPDSIASDTVADYSAALTQALKYGWFAQLVAVGSVTMGKICIVVFLDNVIGSARRARPWFLWGIVASNIALSIVVTTLLLTECHPLSGLWNVFEPHICRHEKFAENFSYFASSWSAFSDFALAIYPAPIIWSLQLNIRTKVALCILLSLGFVAGICAAIKTSQLHLMSNIASVSYNSAPLIVTTMTEQWITFIVACIPPSASLMKMIFSKAWFSASRSKGIVEPGAARRSGMQHNVFGCQPMSQFQSLAYAVGNVNDIYEMGENNSKENMVQNVRDGKGIAVSKNVEIQYDSKADVQRVERISGSSVELEAKAMVALDRV